MKLIIFDIDGTLTDSIPIYKKIYREMISEIGIKEFNADFDNYKHHSDSFIAKEIFETATGENFTKEKLEELEEIMYSKIINFDFEEIKGAKKLIENLQANSHIAICYATGSLEKTAKYRLKSIGIRFEKEQLVGSNNFYSREEIVSQAIENAKKFYDVEDFEQIISVGDGLWDLKTAQNLNIDFIGIGNVNKQKMLENGMTKHFEDLTNFEI
ncbi:HAD family hydrolase [Aureivirga sp. CE67]|uniref:HAD family hydrolase n=1 Tax=Aureivirga sp. CE67 TaxID=1788983 RepID=UPI0018CA3A42|nr:HAD family hydrolase [Aureivirga sp. CE67]